MAATTAGKNILPRAAALLDAQPITDVTSIESSTRFQRPIYAGNAIATVERVRDDRPLMLTIRPTSFATQTAGSSAPRIESLDDDELQALEV
jgi:electron transfer flavoprotein alpha subunit